MNRYAEIGAVLARHGWRAALAYLGLSMPWHRPEVPVDRLEEVLPPSSVRQILSDLGPTYVKIGQLLSTRPDVIPESYVRELERLQDKAPPVEAKAIIEVAEASLGRKIDEAFESFEPQPIASASISQVHAAVYQGRKVAVKIQRPGIERTIETDTHIVRNLARRLERAWPLARRYDVVGLVGDLTDHLRAELDFALEGRNTDRLRESLQGGERIPRIEWAVTTPRVLVMQYMDGVKITDSAGLDRIGVDRKIIARRLAESMVRQIFVTGLFHGDPHPGNLLAFPDNSIGFLDFGNVARLDPRTRGLLVRLLMALARWDSEDFADALLDLAVGAEDVDRRQFVRGVDRMLRAYAGGGQGNDRISRVLRSAMTLVWRNGFTLPAEAGLVVKACVQFEGVCRRLDPGFEVLDLVDVTLLKGALGRLSGRDATTSVLSATHELMSLLLSAPRALNQLLAKSARGELTRYVYHRGLQEFGEHLDRTANRVAYSLVVSASIVGSALLMHAGVAPKLGDLSLIGLAALAVSGFLGGVLLWNILMSGRLR